jgi:hypothetical protein
MDWNGEETDSFLGSIGLDNSVIELSKPINQTNTADHQAF